MCPNDVNTAELSAARKFDVVTIAGNVNMFDDRVFVGELVGEASVSEVSSVGTSDWLKVGEMVG